VKKNISVIKIMILISVLLIFVLSGCSKTPAEDTNISESQDNSKIDEIEAYPEDSITVIVAYGAGGGTDVSARILLPYVEKEIGVPMNVVNITGGAGWVGWTELLKAPKDGYTIAYINTPTVITGYLNPEANRDPQLDNFEVIANHVIDYGTVVVRPDDERFSNLEEFIAYAKENEVTATTTGLGSDDHIALLKFNEAFGTKILPVHDTGYGTSKASVMGGHIDALFVNIGDVLVDHQRGDLKALAIFAPEKSDLIPDVPTVEEITGKPVYNWASRGIAAAKGVPEEIIQKLNKAFLKAMEDEELDEKIKEVGLDMVPMDREEYREFLFDEEKELIKLLPLLGWDK
jgi:tripartite-type tricarboxylate transporter receptor subunit TctC